jgi:transcription initiation factor TFIIIB Brf1 subunit/transcription initiation factor TFIIB
MRTNNLCSCGQQFYQGSHVAHVTLCCAMYKLLKTFVTKCIVKVANKVKLSEKTKRQAAEIMSNITRREISAGKNPNGTVLYISCINTGEKRTQKDIAQAAVYKLHGLGARDFNTYPAG